MKARLNVEKGGRCFFDGENITDACIAYNAKLSDIGVNRKELQPLLKAGTPFRYFTGRLSTGDEAVAGNPDIVAAMDFDGGKLGDSLPATITNEGKKDQGSWAVKVKVDGEILYFQEKYINILQAIAAQFGGVEFRYEKNRLALLVDNGTGKSKVVGVAMEMTAMRYNL